MSISPISVNAFTQLTPISDETRTGSLNMYRFAVKDIFDVKGFCIQAGNPYYFSQAPVAETTAPAITLLQDAGAQLIGKTHTDELGASLFGINKHYGTPLNSTSPDRVPGGSSSGSASAVAANLVDFALGGDTSGSVRAPASFCGIYGLRPTFGRIPTANVLPISRHLDTVGIFSQHPDIIAQVLDVYGIKDRASFTRLRIIPSLVNHLEGGLHHSFLGKVDVLKQLTSSVTELTIAEDMLLEWRTVVRTISMYGLWQTHKDWILKDTPTFGDLIDERVTLARAVSYEDYLLALEKQNAIRDFMNDALAPGDVAVFPTVHDIPPLLSAPAAHLKEYALKAACHTCISALTGFPEITLPLRNIKDSSSLGMSLLARPGQDLALTHFASKAHALIHSV